MKKRLKCPKCGKWVTLRVPDGAVACTCPKCFKCIALKNYDETPA